MRIDHVDFHEESIKHGLCPHIPAGYLACYSRHCETCEIADRIRASRAREMSSEKLFSKENCLKQNSRDGGDVFFRRLIVLSEDALKRLGIDKKLFYQLAYAYAGPGCLPKNTAGAVDIKLIADDSKCYTVYRFEILGVQNEDALKYYNKIFFLQAQKKYT